MSPFNFKIKNFLPSFFEKKKSYEEHRGYSGNTYKSAYDSCKTFIVRRDPSIRSQDGGHQFVPFLHSTLGSNNNGEYGSEKEWGNFLSGRSFGSDISQHPAELRRTKDDEKWEDVRGDFWYDTSGIERTGFPRK